MQIIFFSLLVIGLVGYIIFKISEIYHISIRKIAIVLTGLFVLVSIGIFLSVDKQGNFEELFKEKYKKQFGYDISKLSSKRIVKNQVLDEKDSYYKFIYIVNKNQKTYVCESNDILIQKIEDEYVLKPIKEECIEK